MCKLCDHFLFSFQKRNINCSVLDQQHSVSVGLVLANAEKDLLHERKDLLFSMSEVHLAFTNAEKKYQGKEDFAAGGFYYM